MLRDKILGAALVLAVVLAGLMIGEAQITVPHTFTTSVPVGQLNTNFSTIADGALKRSGGNITGNITANAGVTVDGVDIGAVLGASTASVGAFPQLTTSSTVARSLDVAGGIYAGTGDVPIINSSGRIPAISSTYFADLSAANMTVDGTTQLDDYIYTVANYTPTWTGGGASIGNGTLEGRYMKVGRMVTVTIRLIGGSTTNWGVSAWTFSLPTTTSASQLVMIGSLVAFDASAGGIPFIGATTVSPSADVISLLTASTQLSASAPFTWATNDLLYITLTYESAS